MNLTSTLSTKESQKQQYGSGTKKKKTTTTTNGMTSRTAEADSLAIEHEQPQRRTCRITTAAPAPSPADQGKAKAKLDLESFPQETLLKKLASLFDRITARNDLLSHPRSEPATPSSILSTYPARSRRRKTQRRRSRTRTRSGSNERDDVEDKTEEGEEEEEDLEEDQEEQEEAEEQDGDDDDDAQRRLNARPPQSPTVMHFQKIISHGLYSTLDNPTPSCSPNSSPFSSRKTNQLTTASLELLSKPSSILTFHAKIVPQISIEAYLLRILKYCPTSNGVFLSTLIYLDRLCTFYHHCHNPPNPSSSSNILPLNHHTPEKTNHQKTMRWTNHQTASDLSQQLSFHFVIDSWNVHRFLIASITAASKLLSDVFYTNSRYAKVGGLPLEELEELEIKFLLMSDFRLMISASEFEDYTERLLGPRGTRSTTDACSSPSSSSSSSGDDDGKDRGHKERYKKGKSGSNSGSDSSDEDLMFMSHRHFLLNASHPPSVSSCNSSERSSCSTITPHSPQPAPDPSSPIPTTPRSSFLIPAPTALPPSL
ncbi:hypothetical protein PCANC_17278 [Puccinia coronata f. sp. avenae]|uniref:Cyclin-domain-containing protein n=1 Tax=Puccinia coronata f. sp. avenae TaxID=200324 RepID=A0A2N5U4H7_9BASI|nr:hypothetical protein PCANC_17278 [Puccinia coronata f. sp. avenae]